MNTEERCDLCGRTFLIHQQETWTSHAGEEVVMKFPREIIVLADTSLGTYEICEYCLEPDGLLNFNEADLKEIYEQFGLEFLRVRRLKESITAFEKALAYEETSDLYFNMGNSYAKVPDVVMARRCYEKALRLRPDHAFAKLNLEQLMNSSQDQRQ